MTVFCLIRHALTGATNKVVSGRAAGIHLSAEGHAQAEALGRVLENLSISAIYCSPLERSVETANRISAHLTLPVQVCDSLTEIDYGDWTGADFSELSANKDWQLFNSSRSSTRIPGGESVLDVQARIIAELERLRARHADRSVAVVSHAEPIRAAICHYAGIHLDFSLRIKIEPASFSMIALSESDARILGINYTTELASILEEQRFSGASCA